MLPNEVKPYSESYQYNWRHRENYQEFRFNIMNMMVDDAYDKEVKKGDVEQRADGVYVLSEYTKCSDGSRIGIWIKKADNK